MAESDPLDSLPEHMGHINSFYDLLEVPPNANQGAIKKAYKKKIRKYHPDTSDVDHAEQVTFILNAAMDTLDNQSERIMYNELGHERYHQQKVSMNNVDSERTVQKEQYEPSAYEMISFLDLTVHKREAWWKTVLKSTGFKITIASTLLLSGLFLLLLYI
jgi:curved DNA-binding protein CbpA